jgi:hypothetical protein
MLDGFTAGKAQACQFFYLLLFHNAPMPDHLTRNEARRKYSEAAGIAQTVERPGRRATLSRSHLKPLLQCEN